MPVRSLMILGTGSHVGKSLITAALCRIFHRHGIRVAPFKSQNMSLNSAVTPEGLEIGRAQALQAEAAGIAPSVHMNPILLKPSGNMTSQVIVHGRIWGQLSARDYHLHRVEELLPAITESYNILAAQYDLILLEGAGSPAEINLKQHDLANMRIAELADAPCLLVGDIDRGGVFASLLGTLELLEHHERARIQALIINKFRGDISLLTPGLQMLEDRTGKPCAGVIPHLPHLHLDEEDSLALPQIWASPSPEISGKRMPHSSRHDRDEWIPSIDPARPLRIAVLAFPSLSNFTDLDALRAEPSVDLRLVQTPQALAHADILLLPGSKTTAADLAWLRSQRLDEPIRNHPGLTVGICGGMQMLGHHIHDPNGIESSGTIPGLALLPLTTTMQPAKRTVLTIATLASPHLFGLPCPRTAIQGYETHVGQTTFHPGAQPFATLLDGTPEGCLTPRILGTYLHGLFDDDTFRHLFLTAARASLHLAPSAAFIAWSIQREVALNRWAAHVEQSLDMPRVFALAGFPYTSPTQRDPLAARPQSHLENLA